MLVIALCYQMTCCERLRLHRKVHLWAEEGATMGFFDWLLADVHVPGADGVRILDVPSAMNLRELGGYETPHGPTQMHRFLRCGSTRSLSRKDRAFLRDWGLTHVLDLRGQGESPAQTCVYAHEEGVTWANVTLFGANLSDSTLVAAQKNLDYLSRGYLSMLTNHEAVCQAMRFLATVPRDACALFHCAAGMDRTGMVSMLLLGAADVARDDIVKDYLYSFASVGEVERFMRDGTTPQTTSGGRLTGRFGTIAGVYDSLVSAHGSVGAYLLDAGLTKDELALLRARLLD